MRAEDAPCPTCSDCASPLIVVQPDPGRPDRLLGYCASCDTCFPMANGSGRFEVVGRATLRLRPPRGARKTPRGSH